MGCYVYVHERQDTGLPFYVGKGSSNRLRAKRDRNQYWHNIVAKAGYTPKIIHDDLTHVQALNAEKLTIALFKKFFKLVNLTDGGDGGNGLKGEKHPLYGKPRSEEIKKKLSDALKGRSFPHCATWKGKTQSEEHKAKISATLKGRKKTPEHIKNATAGFKAAIAKNPIKRSSPSEETKRKISMAQKGRVFTEEHKAKLRKPKNKEV
jgi:hypothetical protein